MRLELSDEDAVMLRRFLHDYLPSLRREVAGTDEMVRRQEVVEALLRQLGEEVEF